VHVWTVNAEADMLAMIDLGVDAVITDRPGALLTLLGRVPARKPADGDSAEPVASQSPSRSVKKATSGAALIRIGATLKPMPQVTNIRSPSAP
jgi:hypothetical protein